MKQVTAKHPKESGLNVAWAVSAIGDIMGFKDAARKQLMEFIRNLAKPFPKLPHVRFYAAATPAGANYRATYKIRGYPLRTERLGKVGAVAYQRAQRISDVLQRVHARLMKSDEAHRLLYVDAAPIARHVSAFESSIRARGSKSRYVKNLITRLNRCIELGGFDRIGDIARESSTKLIEKLKTYVEPDKKINLSDKTINDYLAALRQFTRWATPALIPIDPLANTGGIRNPETKKRRDVLVEELAWIVLAAQESTAKFHMRGPDRAMLYLAAYATGLRANELRSLLIPWIKFDAKPPHIAVPASVTKTKTDAKQPMPQWLADKLILWLGSRREGKVWPTFPRDIQDCFEADRAAARELYVSKMVPSKRAIQGWDSFLLRETSDGEIVFHSLRHTYASVLLANMDVKSAQLLTRHATASMLTDTYGHSRMEKAAAGVERAIVMPAALAQGAAL